MGDARTAGVTQRLFDPIRRLRADDADEAQVEKAVREWRQANPKPSGTIHDLVDHIDHIVQIAGIDHVGLGSDYDGIPQLPTQLEDVSSYPYITQALLLRGYREQDIRKVLGDNLLRALRRVEEVSSGWED